MDGSIREGFYRHPQQGLIRISEKDGAWVFHCFSADGSRQLTMKGKKVDNWLWALSEEAKDIVESE